ncbi:RNA polymerase II-associated protein 3 [Merluccius polli]|uniref:RNA polymerase II-associated protein 3 n=1 Tax=Merluccius polli TaxID=89951 RepID=A0AA47NZ91_MERPO|nr:RNA polymerase II-associated protein 3 [Merluccius polli]
MSSGNKAIELQLQMRQNADDLHTFMREMDSWETDMKKKDQELRSGEEVQRTLPPVRNKDFKKKRRKAKPSAAEGRLNADEPKDARRIQSYDYRAWDKFDVDKALSAVDKEESPVEGSDSDSEDATVSADRGLALSEKEKGNALFKEGKYDDAVECYTRGMSADPYNPILPTNRAACFYRLKKFSVAESDCNLAIALDSNYFKAFARRGAARVALEKYNLALEDYETVLKLDPGNVDAETEVKKIKEVTQFLCILVIADQGTNVSSQANPPEEPSDGPSATEAVGGAAAETGSSHAERQILIRCYVYGLQGNAYFKEGKYEAAVECYTGGMEADATNALLPANRAMAYLKLERYKEAEEDCGMALSLDNTYSKAFARRGTARLALGKLKEAQQDFQELLKLEPGNKQALNELQKIKIESGTTGLLGTEENAPRRTVQPIDKPPHLQSTKPLRRLDIEEVGGEVLVTDEVALGAMPHKSSSSSARGHTIEGGDNQASPLSTSPSAKVLKIEEISDIPTQMTALQGALRDGVSRQDPAARLPKAPTTATSSSGKTVALPPPATNSFQFEADLRTIGSQPQQIYKYLRQMEPAAYAKIFHNSLEPDLLNQILRTLLEFYTKTETPALILGILTSLASVRRFDMAVMFMSSPEKKVLRELFDFLRLAQLEGATLETLRKKYAV